MSGLKTTPLHARHKALGAKTAPFAGWDMPIQYTSILDEHEHCRTRAALFDICHMGEFLVSGAGAKDSLARAVTHDLDALTPGRCAYGFLLNESGGVLDDLIVYCLAPDQYMLVVNGACTESDFAALSERLDAGADIADVSEDTAKLDLQGPLSFEVLDAVLPGDFRSLGYFRFAPGRFQDEPMLVSRTGYTGELGYELYVPAHKAEPLWDALLADDRVKSAGLGARDTLRLEMGLPLYGQDLDAEHTPAEAGYSALLRSKAEYVGKGADREVREKLVGLKLEGRRSARHHDRVLLDSGQDVGVVTSGSFAPSLGYSVALASIKADAAEADSFVIQAARAQLRAERSALPFYESGTARTKL